MAKKRSVVQPKAKTKKAAISQNQKTRPVKSRFWFFCILFFWVGLLVGGVMVSFFQARTPISLLNEAEKKSLDIPRLLGQASDVFNNKNYDKAAALYRRVLQIDPNNYDANLYLANVMGDKMDPPDIGSAIYHSDKALAVKRDYRTLIANGGLYWRIQEYAKAEEIFWECTKDNPRDFNAWWELAFMLDKQNKYSQALAAYRKADALCVDQTAKSRIDVAIKAMLAKMNGV